MPTASKSSTTTSEEDLLPLITPGEILLEEFLRPLNLTGNALSLHLHVPANRISEIINGQRAITADTALRLARYFGNSPEFWLNLEQNYQLSVAKREKAEEINRQVIQPPKPCALLGQPGRLSHASAATRQRNRWRTTSHPAPPSSTTVATRKPRLTNTNGLEFESCSSFEQIVRRAAARAPIIGQSSSCCSKTREIAPKFAPGFAVVRRRAPGDTVSTSEIATRGLRQADPARKRNQRNRWPLIGR